MAPHLKLCDRAHEPNAKALRAVPSFLSASTHISVFVHDSTLAVVFLHPRIAACAWVCVCAGACDSGPGRVSIAGGLWLLRSDYIGVTGGASRLVVLSVFCVADCTDTHTRGETRRIETTQPETLGLPPGDLTEKQPHCGFAQEYTSDSWLIWMFCVFLMNLIIVEAESAGRCLMGSCVIKVFILKLSRREKSVLLLKPLICEVMDVFTSVS